MYQIEIYIKIKFIDTFYIQAIVIQLPATVLGVQTFYNKQDTWAFPALLSTLG